MKCIEYRVNGKLAFYRFILDKWCLDYDVSVLGVPKTTPYRCTKENFRSTVELFNELNKVKDLEYRIFTITQVKTYYFLCSIRKQLPDFGAGKVYIYKPSNGKVIQGLAFCEKVRVGMYDIENGTAYVQDTTYRNIVVVNILDLHQRGKNI